MKKIIIGIVAAVVLLGVVALALVWFSLNPIVKNAVETFAPKLLQVEVRLGGVELSPFSGRGKLAGLFVGNPTGFKTPSAIQVGEVVVAVDVASLKTDVIVINELTLQAPQVTLEGTLTGDNNISKLLANIQAVAGGGKDAKAAPAKAAGPEKKFIVKKLVMEGGKVNMSLNLPVVGGKALTAPLPPIHAENLGVAENGLTGAQLATAIIQPMLGGAVSEGEKAVADLTKQLTNLGGQGVQGVGNAIKSVGNLFKK